jgi:DNA-binding MarR family transcriptional regulator/ribosomal protein S18 acetylase RimI-like enzyme
VYNHIGNFLKIKWTWFEIFHSIDSIACIIPATDPAWRLQVGRCSPRKPILLSPAAFQIICLFINKLDTPFRQHPALKAGCLLDTGKLKYLLYFDVKNFVLKMNTLYAQTLEASDHVLVALRRIVRAIDIHSKKLVQSHHLTIPQVVLLREIQKHARLSLGDLARLASLSNATVTGIIDRLEARNLVRRVRSETDRRQVFVEIAPGGVELMQTTPPLLQESFIRKLEDLPKWEQAQILSSLERIASIMNADGIDAAPILAHHVLTASEDDIYRGKNASRYKKQENSGSSNSAWLNSKDQAVRAAHFHMVRSLDNMPRGADLPKLVDFLHESLKPYEDTTEDIERGIRDALTAPGREGGFLLIAEAYEKILGALVMQRTGMRGYVPENILLYVAVSPEMRGYGLGSLLVERAVHAVEGSVKLHVEYDNPARRLYERIGFTSKYAEMRYLK